MSSRRRRPGSATPPGPRRADVARAFGSCDIELSAAVTSKAARAMRGLKPDDDAGRLMFAALVMTELLGDLTDDPARLQVLVGHLEVMAGVPRLPLASTVLSRSLAIPSPVDHAVKMQIRLVHAFSAAASTSLWQAGPLLIEHAGADPALLEPAAQVAAQVIAGPSRSARVGEMAAVKLAPERDEGAALVVSVNEGSLDDDIGLILAAGAEVICATLARRQAPEPGELARVAAPIERRLARLRFDLHDGPQQDIILLGEDLELFGSQLAQILRGHSHEKRLLGRLEDLQARLVALDGDLRRISSSLQSPFLHPGSVASAISELVANFQARTEIEPELRVEGDMAALTDSQHITLLGLVREALSNVREHSGALRVTVTITESEGEVHVTVTDDGMGFDPETSLVRAAREGHLGLVGMHERVRMLGGVTRITSRIGGPTVISARIPAAPVDVPRRG